MEEGGEEDGVGKKDGDRRNPSCFHQAVYCIVAEVGVVGGGGGGGKGMEWVGELAKPADICMPGRKY